MRVFCVIISKEKLQFSKELERFLNKVRIFPEKPVLFEKRFRF